MTMQAADVIILGAGISGLSTAYYLKQQCPHLSIAILEQSDHPGGWIKSLNQDGFVLEQGPRGIRPKGKGQIALDLAYSLGLGEEILWANHSAKRRYLYSDKLLPVPTSPLSLLTSPFRGELINAIRQDLKINSFPIEEQSLDQYMRRHFGNFVADYLIASATSGIWAGQSKALSAQAVMPHIAKLEQIKGSLIKAFLQGKAPKEKARYPKKILKTALFTFKSGLEALPQALAQNLSESLHYHQTVTQLAQHQGLFTVTTTDQTWQSACLISALPAHTLAKLSFNLEPALHHKLSQIDYAPIAVVTLAYRQPVHNLKGFGYLCVPKYNHPILGVIFNDQTFPEHAPQNQQSITVMLGGATNPEILNNSEQELIAIAKRTLKEQIGLTAIPDIELCKKISQAIPQYNLGYLSLLKTIKDYLPQNCHLVGNYLNGVSIINCLELAQYTANKIAQPFQQN